MSNLYPSLEDYKYDVLMNSKHPTSNVGSHLRGGCQQSSNGLQHRAQGSKYILNNNNSEPGLYPSFNIGLNLDEIHSLDAQSLSLTGKSSSVIAPLSGYTQVHKFQPSNSIRQVVICKDSNGKVGLRLAAMKGGVFIVLVYVSSPAALAGLRFGDQILEINDIPVAGYSMQKVHELIKKASPDELRLAVRDRPFERSVTLHKDQDGLIGFTFNKNGRIVSIVEDSSAARNGLLVDHNIVEINAQNVVGLNEPEMRDIIENCVDVVVLTIVPTKIYKDLTKQTDPKLLSKNMDHTAPLI